MNIHKAKKGSSLIIALIMTSIMAGVAGIVYSYSSHQAFQAKKVIEVLKARTIAESGINICYELLRRDVTLANDSSHDTWTTKEFDGGRFQVTPYVLASNRLILASIGMFNSAKANQRVDLRYYPSDEIILSEATVINNGNVYGPYVFTHVLAINGQLSKWAGCGTFSGGGIYVNGNILMTGNGSWGAPTVGPPGYIASGNKLTVSSSTGVEVDGSGYIQAASITAPNIENSKNIVGQKIIQIVSAPSIPEIELSPFYELAKMNSMVKTNVNLSIPDGFSPDGGVLWVDGSINFKGKATGCFIATGGITMEAGAEVRPVNSNWPTIYNKSGEIRFAGQAETYGFVYAGGDVKFVGGGALQGGPVIIMGNLDKGGNSDMIDSIPTNGFVIMPPIVSPQQTTNTPDRLVVTGWQ